MTDFTKDLGRLLLLLLWEVSAYPDPRDWSARRRQRLVARVVDGLCGSSVGCEGDLRQMVDALVAEFAHSPYRDRAEHFGADLMEMMTAAHDPATFLARGRRARRECPKQPVPPGHGELAKRKYGRAKAKCLRELVQIKDNVTKRLPQGRTGAIARRRPSSA